MRRTVLIAIAGCLATAAIVALAGYFYERPTSLKVAVTRDTDDFRLMTAIQHVFGKEHESIRFKLDPVNDAAASAAALENGEADLAVVRSDIAMPPSGQTLVILHRNAVVLMVPAGSPIARITDLRGHKIGIVKGTASGTGNLHLLETILAQYDIAPDMIEPVSLRGFEVYTAVEQKLVDVVMAVGITGEARMNEIVSAVSQAGKGAACLPAGHRIPRDRAAYAERRVAGGRARRLRRRSAETRGEFRDAGGHRAARRAQHAEGQRCRRHHPLAVCRPAVDRTTRAARDPHRSPSTDKGAALPTHPGTAAYIDGEEQTFFEKYSDFIYIGAMLLSVVGSAAAALGEPAETDSTAEVANLMARLLAILKAARSAQSWRNSTAWNTRATRFWSPRWRTIR